MSLTIGVDIGGTKIAAGVVDEDGKILTRTRRRTPNRDLDAVMAIVNDAISELATRHKITAIGVGTAGFVDTARARVMLAPNLGWTDAPLKILIERASGLPTVIENDANAAAWGERRYGAGRGAEDVIAVTVGTGIGGGLIFGGVLYRGNHGMAAEVGHLCVEPGGRLCGCGLRGCWEQYSSGNALVRTARELASDRRAEAKVLLGLGDGTPEGVAGAHITEAARLGDPVALEAFAVTGDWLGRGMADLAAVLDPEAFVIGGGVSEAGDLLFVPTRASFLENLTGRQHREPPELRLAELGNDAGIVGAADLARY
ncbi:MAG: ROK family glucokinase [Actinobacteria bacterium]|nr:ROK family glucokinase [Actinomycetota bacterium]MCB9412259.1 ROK family glucokinase [Actinomycetota bacterium]